MEDANKRTEPGGVHGNPEICGRVACCFREGLDGGTSPALCGYRFYHLMTIRLVCHDLHTMTVFFLHLW